MIQRTPTIKLLACTSLLGLLFLSSFGFTQTAPAADNTAAPSAARLQTEDPNAAPNQPISITGTTAKRVGESTVIHMDLSAPFTGNVPSFALASPPRLVVDLPNVAHRGAKGMADLGVGDIRSATIAQSGARSRMVLNLTRSVPYVVFAEGSRIVVVINPPQGKTFPENAIAQTAAPIKPESGAAVSTVLAPATSAATAAAAPAPAVATAPVRTMPVTVQREIKNIDFRRGEDGAGRVVIDLSDGSTAIDVRQVGATLVVDVERANLPTALRRRLDVTDFATPVQRVSSLQQGSSTRVIIEPKGAWEHSAYQADNRLVVEVRGIKEDPNKLVQGSKSGYKGDKLSLNFQNIDIRSLLQVFADFTNFNIITSDTVQGTVTLRLKDVPWDQALDIVMQSKGLDSRKNGNVVLIAPRDELAAKEKLELEQKSQIANLEPVKSEVFQLQYQKAEDIKKMITENSGGGGGADAKATSTRFLSARGSAGADTRTNQLFVTDTPTKLDEVRKLLGKVDIPIRQVLIEARIVEASDTFSKSLGVKLGFNDRRITQGTVGGQIAGNNYATFSGTQQGVADLTGQGSVTTGTSLGNTNFVNLPALAAGTNAPASFALSLFGSGLTRFINLELSALEADNKGKIISSPRLVTSDATKAVIESGTEIPYASTSSSGTNISFKKAVLKLEVTPQITPEGNVILDLQINKDSRGEATAAGPSIDTRNIKTQVLVENGGTVVVGGVYLQEEANQTNKVPLLGDLPFIGALFRNNQRINNKTELLIFITPKVVVSNALSVSNAGK